MTQLWHWLSYPPHQRRTVIVAATIVTLIVLVVYVARWITQPARTASMAPDGVAPEPPSASSPPVLTRPKQLAVMPPPDRLTPNRESTEPMPVAPSPGPPTVVLTSPPDWSPGTQPSDRVPAKPPSPSFSPNSLGTRPSERPVTRHHRAANEHASRQRSNAAPPRTSASYRRPPLEMLSTGASMPPSAPSTQTSLSPSNTSDSTPSAVRRNNNEPTIQYAPSEPNSEVKDSLVIDNPTSSSGEDFDRSIDHIIDQEMRRYGQGGDR